MQYFRRKSDGKIITQDEAQNDLNTQTSNNNDATMQSYAKPRFTLSKQEASFLNTLSQSGKAGQGKALDYLWELASPDKVTNRIAKLQDYNYANQKNPLELQGLQLGNQSKAYDYWYNTNYKPIMDQANIAEKYGTFNANNANNSNVPQLKLPSFPTYKPNQIQQQPQQSQLPANSLRSIYDRSSMSVQPTQQTQQKTYSFNSIDEADNANLPDGTPIILNGRSATYYRN